MVIFVRISLAQIVIVIDANFSFDSVGIANQVISKYFLSIFLIHP